MRVRSVIVRILRAAFISAMTLVLLTFALVQVEQYLLRHLATRLLADFHSIHLKQSIWRDAQQISTLPS